MIGRVPRCFLVVGIVTAASACDNVSWGGFELSLQGPSTDTTSTPTSSESQPSSESPETPPPATLAMGPLLYAGARDGDSAWVVPVAELRDGGLRALPQGTEGQDFVREIFSTRFRRGQELTLFSEGSRVGTLVLSGNGGASDFCGPAPRARGNLEMIPGAAQANRFIALEKAMGRQIPVEPFRPLRDQYDQRVGSLNLATAAVPQVGAPWPPSLLEIRADLKVFRPRAGDPPVVMATFVYQDQLRLGPAPANAYSLLVLGEPVGAAAEPTYELSYVWYRPVGTEGKGSPRYFSHADWDQDGEAEVLLEVLGERERWWAALDRRGGGWEMAFQDPCGTPGGGGE